MARKDKKQPDDNGMIHRAALKAIAKDDFIAFQDLLKHNAGKMDLNELMSRSIRRSKTAFVEELHKYGVKFLGGKLMNCTRSFNEVSEDDNLTYAMKHGPLNLVLTMFAYGVDQEDTFSEEQFALAFQYSSKVRVKEALVRNHFIEPNQFSTAVLWEYATKDSEKMLQTMLNEYRDTMPDVQTLLRYVIEAGACDNLGVVLREGADITKDDYALVDLLVRDDRNPAVVVKATFLFQDNIEVMRRMANKITAQFGKHFEEAAIRLLNHPAVDLEDPNCELLLYFYRHYSCLPNLGRKKASLRVKNDELLYMAFEKTDGTLLEKLLRVGLNPNAQPGRAIAVMTSLFEITAEAAPLLGLGGIPFSYRYCMQCFDLLCRHGLLLDDTTDALVKRCIAVGEGQLLLGLFQCGVRLPPGVEANTPNSEVNHMIQQQLHRRVKAAHPRDEEVV
jgi:hypothetical protein